MQLQMERCYSDLCGSTGRPTILVFDRGLRDNLAFITFEEWTRALEEVNQELPGSSGRVIDEPYVYKRYDAVIHLVTAADGAATHYKCGHVEDDSGGHVFRRESPEEAIQQDRALQEAWAQHPHQIIIPNGDSFQMKLAEATETVLAIARVVHPADYQQAKEISRKRTRKDK
eukprot:FR743256.1.p1 GENE.FR743256.1~~FR743256.1.p1  ORF type:complete len:196 (+),score=3.83 FR743256.1:73-588(+)